MRQLIEHKKRPQREHQHSLCCGCRLSVSSSEEPDSASSSSRHLSVSSLAHAMVQERLDQMIKDMKPSSSSSRRPRSSSTKFVLIVAMEKPSADPGEDFRESMVDVITANRIDEARDLRRLLEYYVSVNSEEYRCVILEAFYEVCSRLFLYSSSYKAHEYRSSVR